MKKFRDGGYNTLVSTCVGEEGLDIGEVDLIICYDTQKSPIRLIQRMGRTGRKRAGRIVILLSEGKEEQSYKTSLAKKASIYKIITNGSKNFRFYQNNPLMIPKGIQPKCHKLHISISDEVVEEKKGSVKEKKVAVSRKSKSIGEKIGVEKVVKVKKPVGKKKGKAKVNNDEIMEVDYACTSQWPELSFGGSSPSKDNIVRPLLILISGLIVNWLFNIRLNCIIKY